MLPFNMPDIKISGSAPAKLYLKFSESKNVEFELVSNLKGVELSHPLTGWVKEMNGELS